MKKGMLHRIAAFAIAAAVGFGLAAANTVPGTVALAAKKPAISYKKLTLEVGEKKTLKVKNTKKKVKWSSTNKKIATVNSKGKVTAKGKGQAIIKGKIGTKTYTCKVTVKLPRLDAGIYIDEMPVMGTYDLVATNAKGKITWTSSDPSVISLTQTGEENYVCKIKAESVGKATITASCKGMRSDKKVVTVVSRGYYIRNCANDDPDGSDIYFNIADFDEEALRETLTNRFKEVQPEASDEEIASNVQIAVDYLKEEEESFFRKSGKAEYYYDNQLLSDVKWSVDDDKVVSVKDGEITAKAEGHTYVFASYKDEDGAEHEDAIHVVVRDQADPISTLFSISLSKGLFLPFMMKYCELSEESPTTMIATLGTAHYNGENIYSDDLQEEQSKIKWTSSDPTVFTVVDGDTNKDFVSVKYEGKGKAYLIGTYEGAEYKYLIYCR